MPPDIATLKRDDPKFSPLLRQINDPPQLLYYRGNLDLLQSNLLLAVVGSRKADSYGKTAAGKLLPPIVSAGITLVSGLAFGIDSLAHQACVDHNHPTIAVLGGGIDDATIGPRSNFPLAMRILKNDGLLLSEYPPGTPGAPHRYPERNRIIAGLCPATLVIQASEKSGSLITARLALDYNRDVLAVPGPITSPISAGTNLLIQQGAAPALKSDDLLRLFNLDDTDAPTPQHHQLTTDQTLLITTLNHTPLDIDTLCQQTKLSPAIVSPLLIELELLDLVQNVGSARYVRK